MIANKYKYGLIDLSYLLSRNTFAAARGKGVGEFTSGDIVKMTIQTLNKISRDYGVTVDKYVFVRDTWAKEYGGYYRTYLLKGLYKDSREYMTRELLEKIKQDPTKTPEEIQKAELDHYTNEVKSLAKKALIEDMWKFGVPNISVPGWEFDDLAYLAGGLLYEKDDKPSILITKDSDLLYSLTPKLDYFKIPTGGSEPKIITYHDMYQELPKELEGRISLYQYKSILDSLGEGHNDMRSTKVPGSNGIEAVLRIVNGDYSLVEDRLTFEKQLETFNIGRFPRFNEAKGAILDQLDNIGELCSVTEFKSFCDRLKMTISDSYFSQFINRFDPKLYRSNSKDVDLPF